MRASDNASRIVCLWLAIAIMAIVCVAGCRQVDPLGTPDGTISLGKAKGQQAGGQACVCVRGCQFSPSRVQILPHFHGVPDLHARIGPLAAPRPRLPSHPLTANYCWSRERRAVYRLCRLPKTFLSNFGNSAEGLANRLAASQAGEASSHPARGDDWSFTSRWRDPGDGTGPLQRLPGWT